MRDFITNLLFNRNRYKANRHAVIIACFFNPQNNPYRLLAFQKWYDSIKHLNYRILECLIGQGAKSQLPKSEFITQCHADSLLFHKEAILNRIVQRLPKQFRYVFWVDADALFTNDRWLTDACDTLENVAPVVQPFETCFHLGKGATKPDAPHDPKKVWDSYGYCYKIGKDWKSSDFNIHGHTGFAWGARRDVLDRCLFFEQAVIGAGDHILAHATTGDIGGPCIKRAFPDTPNSINEWSFKWFGAVRESHVHNGPPRLLRSAPGEL